MGVILNELSPFFVILAFLLANLRKIIWSGFAFFVILHPK